MYIKEYSDDEEESKEDGPPKPKRSVYIIVFWDGEYIRDRIKRICDSFDGQRFDLPEIKDIPAEIETVKKSIGDAKNVYKATKQSLRDVLMAFDKIEAENE